MSENPLVSVIVLNYNAGELLLNCIESIKKSAYKNLEIIVIDNISTDKSQKKCKEKYPDIKLIQNDENFGYCEGNNIGIRKAKGDFIMILNPDTIVESNCIRELIFAHEKLGEGLYQPKILSLNEKQVLQSTGNMIHIFGFGFAKDKGKKDEEVDEEIIRLRKNLDQQLTNLQDIVTKLANKLQRQLLAKQNRSWEFDLEEGLLDSSKLPRIIIDPFNSLSFKKEKNTEFKDTIVT